MVQLPASATEARITKVLEKVTDYFITEEKNNVESVFTVAGFGFNSNGQNTGLLFISPKNWDKRPGTHNRVEAIAKRANGAFSKIKEGLVFPFNLPAIIELGTATGFDFKLIDQGSLGHEKLTAARNQLLGMAAKHPNILVGVFPKGLEDTPQFKLIIDQEKAKALGASITTINDTMATALSGSYIDDFIDCGRVKKVYIQAKAPFRMLPEDINK